MRVGADVARQGQRKAAGARRAAVSFGGRLAAGGCCAAFESVVDSRGAIPVRRPATARRAPRALEDVERLVTRQGTGQRHRARPLEGR